MEQATTRRELLRLLAGVPLLAAGSGAAAAATARIERLIRDARSLPRVPQRIDFISRSLLGVRYQAHTLIGGPRHPERFVVRDDAFDCVTFCEVVLAAAIARDLDAFETLLRRIRYDHGKVQWERRNHYFAEWTRRNIENRICQPVVMVPSVVIDKTVSWHRALGKRHVSIVAIANSTFLGNADVLSPGDIVGFTSRRSNLDFFHTGLVAFGRRKTLQLRHASRSRGRVVEDNMARFVAANGVKYVTLLRAVEPDAAATADKA